MHKPVLITGASSGIGEVAALLLADRGFKVWAAARRADKLDDLAARGQGRIHALEMDVTDEGSVEAGLKAIADAGDVIYGLVNSAGVSVTGPIESVAPNEWHRQFETNVFGLVNATRAVLPQMRAAGAGRIVNIGSVAGRIAAPFFGVYSASKHAVEGLSDALRREVGYHGVKVSIIRPGFINTSFGEQEQEALEPFMEDGEPYAEQVKVFQQWHVKGHPNAKPPIIVAEKIHHALTADRPHSRYTVPARYIPMLMLRNLGPSAIVDRFFERTIGLDKLKK